jgi:PPOX class probable F420-dependent enzyme
MTLLQSSPGYVGRSAPSCGIHDGSMRTPALTDDGRRFVSDYHLATLSTMGPAGGIHVVAVGFTFIDGVVRIITSDHSQKVRNIERDPRATVAQVAGPQWLSIAGLGVIERDAAAVAHAVSLYAGRYRQPRVNPRRVVIRITPEKTLGSSGLWA